MVQSTKLQVLKPLLAAMGVLALCDLAAAGASLVFNYPSGFAGSSAAIQMVASAAQVGSVIELDTGAVGQHEAGAAWYKTQQNIQAFTTDFTFQLTPAGPGQSIQGITFCVQNSNGTTNPDNGGGLKVSADTNLDGYGSYSPSLNSAQHPIGNSIAVKFDMNADGQLNYPVGGSANSTGLYVNGGPMAALIPQMDLNPSGINLHSGDIMAAHIVYDGSILTLTLRDTTTNAQFGTSWPINIPAVVGGNSAWVGFTVGTIPAVTNNLLTWSFSEGYATRLAQPSFSLAAGSYPSAQSVTLSGPSGATIYYTTNGQVPTSSSNVYTGPISVSSSEIVQAIASQSGYTDSLPAVANYQIAPASSPLINFPSGFANASNLVITNGSAKFNGSALQLTDTSTNSEAGSAWYAVPVNVQAFSTNFTLQLTNPNANGMTFTIQNQPPASSDSSILYVSGGPYAIANDGTGLGYSGATGTVGGQVAGLLNSVAIKFDLYDGTGNTTGLYTNGADLSAGGTDMTSSGVSLHSGHPLNVALAYDGTTLKMSITDTTTNASYSTSWAVNIPAIVAGNTAYVGFTGATGGLTALQNVTAWTYMVSGGPAVPAAPTNLSVK